MEQAGDDVHQPQPNAADVVLKHGKGPPLKLVRSNDLVSADMDGDTVMMSVESGVYFGLTGIAPRIWELLQSPRSADELFEVLSGRYDVSPMVLRADIEAFLKDMQKNGIVRVA